MKDSPKPIAGLTRDFVAQDDERLFAFIDALRTSVNAKVVAEQQRGASLADIVAQVREMVRAAEGDENQPRQFPSHAFRAISRQAVAWCVEAYRPALNDTDDGTSPANEPVQSMRSTVTANHIGP